MADQAFGKPLPAEDAAEDDALERMSREDRAELQAILEKLEAADVVALSVPTPEANEHQCDP